MWNSPGTCKSVILFGSPLYTYARQGGDDDSMTALAGGVERSHDFLSPSSLHHLLAGWPARQQRRTLISGELQHMTPLPSSIHPSGQSPPGLSFCGSDLWSPP